MTQRVIVGTAGELAPGESKVFIHNEMPILILNVDGVFFAISNLCPHAAGPMNQGFIEDGRITCPWHGWSFPLSTEDPPNDGLPRYHVFVEGKTLSIEFPEIEVDKGWR